MEGQIKCFPDKVKLKKFIITKPYMKYKKKKIKNMNSKMTTNSQLSTTKPKKTNKQQEQKLSKQLEQEQIHRNRDHMEGYQWGGGGGRRGEKVQGIRSINGRYKIDRKRLRIVWEMEKPKNLYV